MSWGLFKAFPPKDTAASFDTSGWHHPAKLRTLAFVSKVDVAADLQAIDSAGLRNHFMKSFLIRMLDRVSTPDKPRELSSAAQLPMSDAELAHTIRELKFKRRNNETVPLPASPAAQSWLVRLADDDPTEPAAARAHRHIEQAIRLLRDPTPDTFLGRKTQEPFSNGDED